MLKKHHRPSSAYTEAAIQTKLTTASQSTAYINTFHQ